MLLKPYFENIAEKEYRDSDRVSYSLLKNFIENGPRALIEPQPDLVSDGLTLGSIVDKLLTIPDYNPHDEYKIVDITVDYSGTNHLSKMLIFLKDNPDIKLNKNDEDTLKRIFNILEFKRPPVVTEDFWQQVEVLELQKSGTKCISSSELELAVLMANTLKTHAHTKHIFEDNFNWEVINQAIIFFEVDGVKCKAMLDKVIVDHVNKIIYPIDIKTGAVFNFISNFYKYKYEIQGSFYKKALNYLIQNNVELQDYTISKTFDFAYISRENVSLPLIYSMNDDYCKMVFEGYTSYTGNKIKGIKERLNEIKWHRETDNYRCTKDVFDTNGIISINTPIAL